MRLALARVEAAMAGPIADHARARAFSLAEDHARVRPPMAVAGRRECAVEPVLPADVIGLFVLVPAL